MALFQVQVTRFDSNSNQWVPICNSPCLARVVAFPCTIILSDAMMNHVKTINLSAGFNFQQQQSKHYIVMTSLATYGFVLPDIVAAQSFEVAVKGVLQQQQHQQPQQHHQQQQQHHSPHPNQQQQQLHRHSGIVNNDRFPPPPPLPEGAVGRNPTRPIGYDRQDVANNAVHDDLLHNPFQTAPLPQRRTSGGQVGIPQGLEMFQQGNFPYNTNERLIRPQRTYSLDDYQHHQEQQHPFQYHEPGERQGLIRQQTAPAGRKDLQWSCPACTLLNKHTSVKCTVCGTQKPYHVVEQEPHVAVVGDDGQYDCAQCSLKNPIIAVRCEVCNAPNPNNLPPPVAPRPRAPPIPPEVEGAVALNEEEWYCGVCTARNEVTSVNCVLCFSPGPKRLAVSEEEEGWMCGACTLKNYPTVKKCTACNGKRPEDYVVPVGHRVNDDERQVLDAEKLEMEMKKLQLTQIFNIFGIHLLPNPEPFICPLCQNNVEKGAGVALFQCFHFFCKDCLVVLIKATDGLQVMCPYQDAIACDSSLKMHEIKELLSPDDFKDYLEKTSEAARESDVTFHCRTPDCSGWCFAVDVDGKFVCPLCEVETCVVCRFSHAGMSCEQYNNLVQEIPEEWVNEGQFQDQVLHPLAEESAEWRQVEDFFNSNLQTKCQVVQIQRCQNKDLWRKYAWQKKLMAERNGDDNVNEKLLFHGTRQNNPADIWRGNEGFDLRHGQQGAWGRGSYFAENSQYSLGYAFTVAGQQRQMFVAKVLTGFTCEMAPDNALTMPPVRVTRDDGVKVLYDSVSGVGGGSKIFVVYQLDVAYPAYLITYDLL